MACRTEVVALVKSTWRYDPDEHKGIHHTDAGNAELMARKYKGEVLYCPDIKSYLAIPVAAHLKENDEIPGSAWNTSSQLWHLTFFILHRPSLSDI